MYSRAALPNGLRILTCPMPHVRSTTLCFFVGTGSRFEPAGQAGLSHFLEHMAFKGTASYPNARLLSQAIEGVGGLLDATTTAEVTSYWAKVPAGHFERALQVLSEMLLCPLLEPAEVEKERRVILEELHMITDSPPDWAFQLIGQALWPDHPLGRDVAGTPESVAAIREQDLRAFREERYIPGRIVATVAGALPPEVVESALGAALGNLAAKPTPSSDATPPCTREPRLVLGYRDTEQANICLAVPALSYVHPDRYAQLLLDTILGAGMSSRLFQSIREERALAYSIYSTLRQYSDIGAIVVYAGVDAGSIEECLTTVWAELQRLGQEDVSPEELERAKEFNKGRVLLRMEDSYGVASWYGMQELLLEQIEEVDQVMARIEAVQPADIRRLAETLFRRECLCLAVVGPYRDEAPLRRPLGL